jgi:hypothetical protein
VRTIRPVGSSSLVLETGSGYAWGYASSRRAEAIAVEAQEGLEPEIRTRPLARSVLKELVFPGIAVKPASLFRYR